MTTPFLELQKISKVYAGVKALDNVDFTVQQKEIHCLVGENGSGKSTLIKIISGVIKPEPSGKIIIEGEEISHLTSKLSTSKGIHVIYQDLSLFPTLTVAENIAFNLHTEGNTKIVNWKTIQDTSEKILAEIGINLNLRSQVSSLSIADQQLVAICRALVGKTRLLILDEPTSSLTKYEVDSLIRIIHDLQNRGITTLFISHKLNEIFEIADNVTVLRDGKKIGTFKREDLNYEKLTYYMTGKKIEYTKLSHLTEPQKYILEIKNLSKKGNFKDINFSLKKGEILGITGLLGSGRTELALALFGMNPYETGEIYIDGKKTEISSNTDSLQNGIAYVPENRLLKGLVMNQSIQNNILITILNSLLDSYNLLSQSKKDVHSETWIKNLSIKVKSPYDPVMTLSGGNQQKVLLAKWIATHPKILILDEPTSGIDVAAKSSIHALIRKLAEDGMSIILISSEVHEVLYNCHRILIMRKGHLCGEVYPDEVTEKELFTFINEGYCPKNLRKKEPNYVQG